MQMEKKSVHSHSSPARVVSRAGAPSCSLYNTSLVSMEEAGGYQPEHATGFIAMHALRLREHGRLRQTPSTSGGAAQARGALEK